jgi:hypothetical protein
LRQGETLFLPALWSHAVVSTPPSGDENQLDDERISGINVAVNLWFAPYTASFELATAALNLGAGGLPLVVSSIALDATSADGANVWAQAVVAQYVATAVPFVAVIDVCACSSESMLRWAAFSALAFGARGLSWQHATGCNQLHHGRFDEVTDSVNAQIGAWASTLAPDTVSGPGGLHATGGIWSSGFVIPYALSPGSGGKSDFVQYATPNALIVQLSSVGAPASSFVYIVDQRIHAEPGAASVREVHVRLHDDVISWRLIGGDCATPHCKESPGNILTVNLAAGSGQLVAATTNSRARQVCGAGNSRAQPQSGRRDDVPVRATYMHVADL